MSSSDIRHFIQSSDRNSQYCPRASSGGTCWADNCKYSHNKEDAPICKMWQQGFCIGGRGNNCPLRHYYNEWDGPLKQSKRFQDNVVVNSASVEFSSPYRVKVVKEVEKQRMEEIDLDTGRRRSWIQTKEVEIYDLTGDTPAKPARSPMTEKSNNIVMNLAKELKAPSPKRPTRSSSMPPPPSPKPAADDRTCPVCHRMFKSERGVKQHRVRSVSCAQDKENEQVTVRTSAPADDSVILISDTPPHHSSTPVSDSRRRSTRIPNAVKKR